MAIDLGSDGKVNVTTKERMLRYAEGAQDRTLRHSSDELARNMEQSFCGSLAF